MYKKLFRYIQLTKNVGSVNFAISTEQRIKISKDVSVVSAMCTMQIEVQRERGSHQM